MLGGIAALRALRGVGFVPRRPIDVVMFTSEEPTRFGLSCAGSRAMAGALTPAALAALRDKNGTGWLAAAAAAGYGGGGGEQSEAGVLAAARLRPGALASFVELHIEQV